MKTINVIPVKFMELGDKTKIMNKIESTDADKRSEVVKEVMAEMDRLEGLVRDYEMILRYVSPLLEGRTFKQPTPVK